MLSDGKLDYSFSTKGQELSTLLNTLKTSPSLQNISKHIPPVKKTEGKKLTYHSSYMVNLKT